MTQERAPPVVYCPSTQGVGAWSADGHSNPAGHGVHDETPLPEV